MDVTGLSGVKQIAAGNGATCAVLTAGTIKCWGWNTAGRLGLSDATHVALTNSHVCVTRTGGSVQCWGLNADGELGNGTKVNASSPVNVVGLG